MIYPMTTEIDDLESPYLEKADGSGHRLAYHHIPFHRSVQNPSIKHLRLEDYHESCGKFINHSTSAPTLLGTWRIVSRDSTEPVRAIRGLDDASHRHLSTEYDEIKPI